MTDYSDAVEALRRAEQWIYEREHKDDLAVAASVATARAYLIQELHVARQRAEIAEDKYDDLRELAEDPGAPDWVKFRINDILGTPAVR